MSNWTEGRKRWMYDMTIGFGGEPLHVYGTGATGTAFTTFFFLLLLSSSYFSHVMTSLRSRNRQALAFTVRPTKTGSVGAGAWFRISYITPMYGLEYGTAALEKDADYFCSHSGLF